MKYCLILKTGEAEIRAIQNSSRKTLEQLFPVIEVTRGRKRTIGNKSCYPFDNRLSKLKECLAGLSVGIDATSSEALSSSEIDSFYEPIDGYANWVKFVSDIDDEACFSEVIPTILVNNEDEDFEYNLRLQVKNLKSKFCKLIYRSSIEDDSACYEDLTILRDLIKDVHLYIIIDCEYTPQASYINVADKCIARINNIKSIISENTTFIVVSTSFPNNISDIGANLHDEFRISEISLLSRIQNECGNDIVYGDYGSISVRRNDDIVMARGWIPRIDIPTENSIFYYKQRRPKGTTAYSSTYNTVANWVIRDRKFPSELSNWGIKQVIDCAKGATPSSSPSFWISVRMCIFIEQQVKRLNGR